MQTTHTDPGPSTHRTVGSHLTNAEGPGSACVQEVPMFAADERRKLLIAAKCCKPAMLHTRSADASHNELATDIEAASIPPSAKCAALAFAAIDRSLRACNDQSARTDAATRAAVERMPIPGVTVDYRGGVA